MDLVYHGKKCRYLENGPYYSITVFLCRSNIRKKLHDLLLKYFFPSIVKWTADNYKRSMHHTITIRYKSIDLGIADFKGVLEIANNRNVIFALDVDLKEE